ncbi:MAG: sigma-70 family RNA polymerase sigma factor, partial [Planctomycetota bacterium]|nr:sigma-70 family RNA polymerase sigma factor [Planctomycetota bacterium]
MEELKSLVTRSRAGDVDAYGEIVRRFQDMAYGYAYSILGDFHLAEDAAQEAFIEAYRCLGNLHEPAAFPGWFRRIVFKHCDRLMRRKEVAVVPLDAAASVASPDRQPSQQAEDREMSEKVLAAIRSLPEQQREVTTLFYINGYSQETIAEFLEVPAGTVKSRLAASRNRLKERMLNMVEETLHKNAPDERFSKKVIEELLARPRPLEIEGHPIRQTWELICSVLSDYEVIRGEEVVDCADQLACSGALDYVYPGEDEKALRTSTTVTTLRAMVGRTAPVKLLTGGRVFRGAHWGRDYVEDATHLHVFHQVDALCVQRGADVKMMKSTIANLMAAVLDASQADLKWEEYSYPSFEQGLELSVKLAGRWLNVAGCG